MIKHKASSGLFHVVKNGILMKSFAAVIIAVHRIFNM